MPTRQVRELAHDAADMLRLKTSLESRVATMESELGAARKEMKQQYRSRAEVLRDKLAEAEKDNTKIRALAAGMKADRDQLVARVRYRDQHSSSHTKPAVPIFPRLTAACFLEPEIWERATLQNVK